MKIYRIYLNDNTLIIADKLPEQQETIQVIEENDFNFKTFYDSLGKLSAKQYALISDDPKAIFKPM